jgi:tetratricopeptide (TPR) repeat protein
MGPNIEINANQVGAGYVAGNQYIYNNGVVLRLSSNVAALPVNHVVKRTGLLDQLAALFESLTIVETTKVQAVGEGGQGKTWLARAYAFAHRDRYPGGVLFASCEGRSLPEVLYGLHGPKEGLTQQQIAQEVRAILNRLPRWLLILDNVEGDAQWSEFLASGLLPTEHCHLIVTTRALDIPSLAKIDVGRLTEAEAVELLATYAPAAAHGVPAVETILRETECMAALLAAVGAALADGGTLEDYATWLGAVRPEAIPEQGHPFDGYPLKTAAILDDLYRRLSPVSRRILDYAAIIPADRIRLEWLTDAVEIDRDAGDASLVWGTQMTCKPDSVDTYLRPLKDRQILTPFDAEDWSLHRLHRKRLIDLLGDEDAVRRSSVLNQIAATQFEAAGAAYHQGLLTEALPGFGTAIAIFIGLRDLLDSRKKSTPALHNALAAAYTNQSLVLADAGDLSSALSDNDAAIALRKFLLTSLEPSSPQAAHFRHALAGSYLNRGNVRVRIGDFDNAVVDFEAAIKVMGKLRTMLELRDEWSPAHQNHLAGIYDVRGVAHANLQRYDQAFSDYRLAIRLRKRLRSALEPHDEWTPEFRNDLATTYMNRGNIHTQNGNLAAAKADFCEAITIREGIRTILDGRGEWTPALRNALAAAYSNRGNALYGSGDFATAVADHSAAIAIREDVRKLLEPRGVWTPALRNTLAGAYSNRGVALAGAGDLAAAVADHEVAIAIREGIRDALEPKDKWTPELRNDLASAHMNRGVALQGTANLASAVAEHGSAISIREGIRNSLGPLSAWIPRFRNELASAYMNRGFAGYLGGEFGAAVADYSAAIELLRESVAEYPQAVAITLQKTLAARNRIQPVPNALALLAAENADRLRDTFPPDYLQANKIPAFNAIILGTLRIVEPPLTPDERTRIEHALRP